MKLIDMYLEDIVTQMCVGQLYLEKTYFIGRDLEKLTVGDFAGFTTLNSATTNFKYKQINTQGILTDCSMVTFSEIDIFNEERLLVCNNIKTIFSFPHITTLDYETLNLLHKISSSPFYIGVKHIKNGITYLDFNQHMYEHYNNYLKLKKIKPPRSTEI